MIYSVRSQRLTVVLLLFALRVLSQEVGKFQVGLSYSPNIDKVIYTGLKNRDWAKKAFSEIQKPAFGQTIGLNCYYAVSDHFTLGSGLVYSKKVSLILKWITLWLLKIITIRLISLLK